MRGKRTRHSHRSPGKPRLLNLMGMLLKAVYLRRPDREELLL